MRSGIRDVGDAWQQEEVRIALMGTTETAVRPGDMPSAQVPFIQHEPTILSWVDAFVKAFRIFDALVTKILMSCVVLKAILK